MSIGVLNSVLGMNLIVLAASGRTGLVLTRQALGRQALHAAVLGFAHPITGAPLRFETPPPADLAVVLEALRAGA